jgi:60 kDa SS-A/Ro ribonucleoprotein
MARTNITKAKTAPIYTYEGGRATKISIERQLERSVLSTMLFEGQFYEDGVEIATRIADLTTKAKPEFVAELALKARSEGNLRHVPLHLVNALIKAKYARVDELIADVIQRPDEMAELVAMYWAGKKKPLAAKLKKGLAKAFVKFDAYQVAKYRGLDNAITLRDIMFLVHPTPIDKAMVKVYKQLADNTLAAPKTWEKRASAGEDQKKVFTSMIKNNKLGALAMLRNLRNMQEAGVSDDIIRQGLSQMNVERVLPFRFITAAKYAPKFETELEAAMFKNLELEDKLLGKTVVLVDISGSMEGTKVSAKSELDRMDAALALAMLLREICEKVEIYSFSNNVVLVPPRRGFALRDAIRRSQPIGGTYLGAAVAKANTVAYDRLIVFTDEQSADRVVDPKGLGYMINVASYRNGVGYKKWIHLDGFSESIVKWIQAFETEVLD